MSYNIVKSDGSGLATVNDGQINSSATSLTLVGKNYPGYGTFLNENFVKVLENFSSGTPPSNPLAGQLWWNQTSKILSVYSQGAWKNISGAQTQADEPTNKVQGDFWFDSVNQQLKVWSGASWVLIGPSFTSVTGASGAFAETITDSSRFSHVVVKFLVQNRLVAILSKDAAFSPGTPLTGFDVINPGFNLASNSGYKFYTTAYDSERLGGVEAAQYVRADNSQFSSAVVIASPTNGLKITDTTGQTPYFTITAPPGTVKLTNTQQWPTKIITYPSNQNGNPWEALTIDAIAGELIAGYAYPTSNNNKVLTPKGYVDQGLQNAISHADSNKLESQGYTDVLWSNANVTYSNVRTLQSGLGYSTTSGSDYIKIVSGGSASFATNLVTLWGNVTSIAANVRDGYYTTILGQQTYVPSLWANIYGAGGLASTVKSLNDNALSTGGGTLLATDTQSPQALRPGTDGGTNLGSASVRFGTIFSQLTNSPTYLNVTNITSAGTLPATDAAKKSAGDLNMYANVTYTGNIRFNQSSGIGNGFLGIASAFNVYGILKHDKNIEPLVTGSCAIGSSTKRYTTIYATTFDGTATAAQYADLAERFEADGVYKPGTLVRIGGDKEVTQENEELSEDAFGVVSTDPAYLMNKDAGDDETHPAIALSGRVPVRVVGQALKGQRLVAAGNGCVRVATPGERTAFNVIGRALEDKHDTEEGLIEALVRLSV